MEPRVRLGQQVRMGAQEEQDLQGRLVSQVLRVLRVIVGPRDLWGSLVLQGQQGQEVSQGNKEPKGLVEGRVILGHLDHQDLMDHPVRQDHLDNSDHQDPQVHKELLEMLDLPDRPVLQEVTALMEFREPRVPWVLPEPQE